MCLVFSFLFCSFKKKKRKKDKKTSLKENHLKNQKHGEGMRELRAMAPKPFRGESGEGGVGMKGSREQWQEGGREGQARWWHEALLEGDGRIPCPKGSQYRDGGSGTRGLF